MLGPHPIVLASASPRRRELIGYLVDDFEFLATELDESFDPTWEPRAIAVDLAIRKALAGSLTRPDAIVVAADTIVFLDGVVLNKPDDRAHAREMLMLLNGRSHLVYTGIAVTSLTRDGVASGSVETAVYFRDLSEGEIEHYLDSEIWHDKAGSYGIQGSGGDIVLAVTGCFQNVVGFPLCAVGRLLRANGVSVKQQPAPCGLRTLGLCPTWSDTPQSGAG